MLVVIVCLFKIVYGSFMEQYDIIKFNKNDIIIKSGEKPVEYFYIIVKGKAKSHNDFYENYKYQSKKGSIIGLISSLIDEPYFSTVEALEETEVLKIKIDSIINIKNEDLLDKIYNYLYLILETWLSKYYTILAKKKVDLYNKDDILTMAYIYKNNGHEDAVYKMCHEYLNLFPDNNYVDEINNILKTIKPIREEPELIEENVYKFKKGYCLYSEVRSRNHIYIIKSGKVGVYSVLNSKQTMRCVYTDGYMINGYHPILDYKPLLTTAIVLEESVITIINKKELVQMIEQNKELRINFIKMVAVKVNNAILKIKAIKTEELYKKLIIIIYSILKMEFLFNNQKKLKLPYKINDIKNMLDINNSNKEVISELKKIKYIEVDSFDNITISEVENYFNEYKSYTF